MFVQPDTKEEKKKKRKKKSKYSTTAKQGGARDLQLPPDSWRLNDTLFVQPLSASLLCPLHKGLFVDPVIAKCGHTFCRSCITGFKTASDSLICPLDSTELSGGLIPNLALLGQIKDLLVYCKYGVKRKEDSQGLVINTDGCQEKITLGTRQEHEDNCPHAPAECPYCDLRFLKSNLDEHLLTCASLPCPHKRYGCHFIGAKDSLDEHLSKCGYEAIKGYLQQNERQVRELEEQLIQERQDNVALRETIAQLLGRVAAIETKNTHYDSVIVRWNQGQLQVANSPIRVQRQPVVIDEEIVGAHSFKCKATFLGHDGPVWALAVAKSQQVLISGSSDKTIRVWDLESHKTRHTLTGHEGIVHAIVLVGKRIISGSEKTIKVWNMKTMKLERTITGHNHTICKLVVEDNFLFSGSFTEIKVWDLKTFECVETLKGHNHWVRALCVSNGLLYSGCYNLIKIWDIKSFRCVRDITGHYGSIYSVVVVENYLLAGTYENAIMVFDLATLHRIKELAGHCGAVYAVCAQDGKRVFSGSYDSTIKVWNLENFRCIQTLKRHTSSVEALICDGDSVYSASSDNSIKVFR